MKAHNTATGMQIVAAVERYTATTKIDPESFAANAEGGLAFEFAGEGAEVNWDLGEHAREGKQRLFVDADGEFVEEQHIVLGEVGDAAHQRLAVAFDTLADVLDPERTGEPEADRTTLRAAAQEVLDAQAKLDAINGWRKPTVTFPG